VTASSLRAVLLVLLASTSADAEPRLELGAYAGPTSAKTLDTYDCPPPTDPSDVCVVSGEPHYSEPGFAAGVSLRVPVHPAALVGVELAYAQKGINGGPNGTHRTYHYVEVPLLVHIDPFRAWSPVHVFAYSGLASSLRVGCTVNGPIFDNDIHMAVDYYGSCTALPPPLDRVPRIFDLGLVVGAGLGLELPFGTVEVQGRYTHGLIDIEDDGGKTINRARYLLLGFTRSI
jgi:hypothetical protein